METFSWVESVRHFVVATMGELGAGEATAETIQETLLLRQGFYAGRRFSCGGISACWLIDDDSVTFRDEAGRPLRTVPLPAAPARRAA